MFETADELTIWGLEITLEDTKSQNLILSAEILQLKKQVQMLTRSDEAILHFLKDIPLPQVIVVDNTVVSMNTTEKLFALLELYLNK